MKKTTIIKQNGSLGEEGSEAFKQVGDQRSKDSVRARHDQKAREANIKALVRFFESGITEKTGRIGIELEHTIVNKSKLLPVSYSQHQGVLWILEQLRDEYPQTSFDAEGDLLGLARPFEAITLEPAAQLELSAGPFDKLSQAADCFESFKAHLDHLLAPADKQALLIGYHPSTCATDLELIPKQRYKFMNTYLSAIGSYGPCMMRGSAATQVSIDYSSVEDCLRKLRLSFALVPILSLICDNSPLFEGEPRKHKLIRTKIWQKCDPDRCGLVPGVMETDFNLRKYAEYILDNPAILAPANNGEWHYSEKTFGEIYHETAMDQAAVAHAVSMFFTDVRLKTYLEIRPADAMPVPFVIAYAALIKALFYSAENLDALDELFQGLTATDVEMAKERLMEEGYDAFVYGKPVAELADILISLATKGLDAEELHYLNPLSNLVAKRETLAEKWPA